MNSCFPVREIQLYCDSFCSCKVNKVFPVTLKSCPTATLVSEVEWHSLIYLSQKSPLKSSLGAWTRFELVSTAKEWNTEKPVMILPTLLHGKLVDYYVELDEAIKASMKLLKTALMTRAGLIKDPLTAGKIFIPPPPPMSAC